MLINENEELVYLVGQKDNMTIIDKWETLPQFLIIQGDQHTGKSFFAKYLAQRFDLMYKSTDVKVSEVRDVIKGMTKRR